MPRSWPAENTDYHDERDEVGDRRVVAETLFARPAFGFQTPIIEELKLLKLAIKVNGLAIAVFDCMLEIGIVDDPRRRRFQQLLFGRRL